MDSKFQVNHQNLQTCSNIQQPQQIIAQYIPGHTKHLLAQKEELTKQVEELLNNRIIKTSQSSYSVVHPVLDLITRFLRIHMHQKDSHKTYFFHHSRSFRIYTKSFSFEKRTKNILATYVFSTNDWSSLFRTYNNQIKMELVLTLNK